MVVSERQLVGVVKTAGIQPGSEFQVWKSFVCLRVLDEKLAEMVICIEVLRLAGSGLPQRFLRLGVGGIAGGTGDRLFAERCGLHGQRFPVSHNRVGTMPTETGSIGDTRHGEVRLVKKLRLRLRGFLGRSWT